MSHESSSYSNPDEFYAEESTKDPGDNLSYSEL